jgi:hypothetical protein
VRAGILVAAALLLPAAQAGADTLPRAPVVSARVRAIGSGGWVGAGSHRERLRRGAVVRLEAVRTARGVRVALGSARWHAHGAIRIGGPVRVRRVLATGRSPAALIAHRLLALEPGLRERRIPDGSEPGGGARRTRGWKRGFYAGALWRAIEDLPRARRVLEPVAWRATRAVWGGEGEDSHDVGFVYGEADGGALRVGCARPSADCRHARLSLRRAAATLRRLAAATPAGVVPVRRGDDTVLIDSAMNMAPLLAEGRALADRHLGFLARVLVRPDGSTAQRAVLDTRTDAVLRRLGHAPLGPGSTWARGQAWALLGFATAGAAWAPVAARTADWIVARGGATPGWDWARPAGPGNPRDTSAAAIAAAGLGRLIAAGCGARCAAWTHARDALLADALRHVSGTPGRLGRFDGQRYLWDPSRRIDSRGEYLMGTDYLLEALSSRGSRRSATVRSTASRVNGASASAARSE